MHSFLLLQVIFLKCSAYLFEQCSYTHCQVPLFSVRQYSLTLPLSPTRSYSVCSSVSYSACVSVYTLHMAQTGPVCTLLENLTEDAIAYLYVTKISTISLYLPKLYVTYCRALQQRHQSHTAKSFLTVQAVNRAPIPFQRYMIFTGIHSIEEKNSMKIIVYSDFPIPYIHNC